MNSLLHREKYIQNKYFFFNFFFLLFQRFKRSSCILNMFYLCETNEHFKNSVFHTSKLALYLFPCPISLLTLTKLTLLKKQKTKTKEERGFTLPLFILLYSLQYYLFFFSLICVFFFQFQFYSSTLYLWEIVLHNFFNSLL
jgi:hypothetical protein